MAVFPRCPIHNSNEMLKGVSGSLQHCNNIKTNLEEKHKKSHLNPKVVQTVLNLQWFICILIDFKSMCINNMTRIAEVM